MRALLVETDAAALQAMMHAMAEGGFDVDSARDSEGALDRLICHRYDVVVLNAAVFDLKGERLYDRLRRAGLATPIVLLVGEDDQVDSAGVISVTKDAVLPADVQGAELLDWSSALIDFTNIIVEFMDFPSIIRHDASPARGKNSSGDIELTLAEKKLLGFLLKNRGRTVYKREILESVWNTQEEEIFTNIVEVYIARLRRKLGEHGKNLLNIRGVGYRLEV